MSGYRWQAAAAEIAEWVRTIGPRIALVSRVFFVLTAVPVLLRLWVYLPRGVL